MINESRWLFHINNMFMKQDITVQIKPEEDGKYSLFAVTSKGLRPFPKEAADTVEFDGDSFKAKVSSPDSPMMKIEIAVKFGEEKAEGYFKLPILGKMKFEGEKVELTDLPIIEKEISVDDAKEKLEE